MKKAIVVFLLCVLVCASVAVALTACDKECKHEQIGEWQQEILPSCNEEGVLGHYECAECGKVFDAEMNPLDSLSIAKTDAHSFDGAFDAECNVCLGKFTLEILRISIEKDFALITFVDGRESALALSVGKAGCEHRLLETKELIAHTARANGYYLDTCGMCGMVQVSAEKRHIASESRKTIESTCTVDGAINVICKDCDAIMSSEPIAAPGHVFNEPSLVIDPEKNLCEDGGHAFKTCTVCGENSVEKIEPASNKGIDGYHTVNNWSVRIAPTYDTTGMLVGICEVCQDSRSYVLPKIKYVNRHDAAYGNGEYNDGNYLVHVISEKTSCVADDGITECTFVVDNDTKQSFTFTVAVPVKAHKLNGETMDKQEYDIDIHGIEEHDGEPPVMCYETGRTGCYTCDVCQTPVIVPVYKNHTLKSEITKEPTCTLSGIKTTSCCIEGCEYYYDNDVEALGHSYEYTLSYIKVDGKNVFSAHGICTVCEDECTVEHSAIIITSSLKEATCVNNGLITYTAANLNGMPTTTEQTPKVDHIVSYDETGAVRLSLDGVYYIEDYPEISAFGNVNVTCYEVSKALFRCEYCQSPIEVNVKRKHVYSDDKWEILVNADCDSDGERRNFCAVEECRNEYTETITAFGHSFKYIDITENADSTECTLTKVCERDDCGLILYPTAVIVEKNVTNPTCTEKGIVVYSFIEEDGTCGTYSEESEMLAHSLNGVFMDNDPDVPYIYEEHPGIELLENTNLVCYNSIDAIFTCDCCNDIIPIKVRAQHVVAQISWKITVPAGCESEGIREGLCMICGANHSEIIEPKGHNFGYSFDLSTNTASCKCGKTKQLYNVSSTVVSPTCVSAGFITYKGVDENGVAISITKNVSPIAHKVSGVLANENGHYPLTEDKIIALRDKALVCEETTEAYYVCEACERKVFVIAYKPHDVENYEVVIAPTCTEDGSERGVCLSENCPAEDNVVTRKISKSGHSYDFDMCNSILPTETKEGILKGKCNADNCGAVLEISLPALHSGEYTVIMTKVPTCTKDGEMLWTVVLDDSNTTFSYSFGIPIAKFGHVAIGGVASTFTVEEIVDFITDADGNPIEVNVNYVVKRCDGKDCDVSVTVSKWFEHDGKRYEYSESKGWREVN